MMRKWFAGGANKITLSRIPCMLVACYALFWPGRTSVAWFWVGVVTLVIGMILDGLDGWWARHVAKGATSEGQYLDPFVDKWGFVYPFFVFICWRLPQPPWFVAGLALLCLLDIRSNLGHYRNYRRAVETGFNPDHGAVWPGKVKFVLQNTIISVIVGRLCPVDTIAEDRSWVATISRWLVDAAAWLQGHHALEIALPTAICLAGYSLFKRKKLESPPHPRTG